MNDFTPEQNQQLASWASERDSILSDIASKRDELNRLKTQNENLAQSNTEIQDSIKESRGRLAELRVREAETANTTTAENAALRAEKTGLETTITSLRKDVAMLNTQKEVLTYDITTFKDVYDRIVDRTAALDNIMNHVIAVSDENIRKVDILMGNLAGSIQKVLDVNEANVNKANMVIMEMPKMFFELQKQQPLKKPIII
jgi:chromosome segregation ATPase